MAHLDTGHKEFLFSELEGLKSQVWFSGVSKDLFENINNQTVFFDMKNVVWCIKTKHLSERSFK